MSRPPSYGCNDNQNYFVESGRTTSRVRHAPGGKTSINLGWDSDEENIDNGSRRRQRGSKAEVTGKIGQVNSKESTMPPAAVAESHTTSTVNNSSGASDRNVSGNAFANGNNQNCGNVITDRPSSRVLNPPGGKTSIQLG
mmetsp:Transcript_27762/g.33770  ORF Transcript_27762/g.33770 Transcript_27762/m.33770 type:complete len:140 (+) Transcript_27762:134-553(+)|eukprot:CAMPEP_0172496618 /NCGR_PEP_ID=MMETSP1066-20121228/90181_1 /TAXON_ID=671091 /ORGANISM="Coscinodiscus wailesii, Strain CCMP2513" /LENGTH=139 /DNA_ID=CAMNT_0013268997 /DNA_START=127 /DNA_END=546 /DNA_ORIENTATION=+